MDVQLFFILMREFFEPQPKEIVSESAIYHNEKQYVLKSQMVPMKGHILWDYDSETKKLVRAEYEMVMDFGSNTMIKKVITKPGHDYFQALNERNAIKKLLRAGCL